MLAVSTAGTGALAQTRANSTTMLPVWNSNGQVEGALILEPTDEAAAGARWRMGRNTLSAAFGLDAGESLGLLCNNRNGIGSSISSLITYCNVARLDDDGQNNGQHLSATTSLSRPGGKLGVSVGSGRDSLPGWLSPNNRNSRVDQNTLTVYGQKNIGREAMVSIGGTWARAKLIPAGEMPGLADRWSSRSITIGAGIGNFGANIVGRVVDTPGQPGQWEGLGVGLTWRTPWSGQLTVGAENVVTRGKNPFAPGNGEKDEGTVPYVRYEQDL